MRKIEKIQAELVKSEEETKKERLLHDKTKEELKKTQLEEKMVSDTLARYREKVAEMEDM